MVARKHDESRRQWLAKYESRPEIKNVLQAFGFAVKWAVILRFVSGHWAGLDVMLWMATIDYAYNKLKFARYRRTATGGGPSPA